MKMMKSGRALALSAYFADGVAALNHSLRDAGLPAIGAPKPVAPAS